MIKAFLKWWRGTPSFPTSHLLYQVVYQAWAGGFTVSSDLARREAGWVAVAAGLGLITTVEVDGSFGRTWYVTQGGLRYLDSYWSGD